MLSPYFPLHVYITLVMASVMHITAAAYGPGDFWPDFSKAAVTCISMKRPGTNAPVNMTSQPNKEPVVPSNIGNIS